MKIQELLHKRVLLADKERGFVGASKTVKEVKVLEIAPSENWVKIQDNNGRKYWLHSSDITLIEVLASFGVNGE